jgi:histone deacetylase 6
MGDADYLAVFDEALLPIARAFGPDLVLVSAGFDAAAGDPLGEMRVSPGGFGALTARLSELARGRLVLALEGGYDLGAISASAAACVAVLLGDAPPVVAAGPVHASARRVLDSVLRAQRPYWPTLG